MVRSRGSQVPDLGTGGFPERQALREEPAEFRRTPPSAERPAQRELEVSVVSVHSREASWVEFPRPV